MVAYLEATISPAQMLEMYHFSYEFRLTIPWIRMYDLVIIKVPSHPQVPCGQSSLIATFQTADSNGDNFSGY